MSAEHFTWTGLWAPRERTEPVAFLKMLELPGVSATVVHCEFASSRTCSESPWTKEPFHCFPEVDLNRTRLT